jgi:hypothetical protein
MTITYSLGLQVLAYENLMQDVRMRLAFTKYKLRLIPF